MARVDVHLTGGDGGDPLDAYQRGLAWYQANTGHSGSLQTHAGFTANTADAVYEDQDYTGAVTITAARVTFRNCRFQYPVNLNGSSAVIEQCTMLWTPGNNGLDASYGSGTVRLCNLSGGGEHFRLVNDVTIEDCWSHGLTSTEPTAHNENLISGGNSSGVTVRRCWIDSDGTNIAGGRAQVTGAINMSGWAGTFSGWTIDHNLLMGDGFLLGPGLGGPDVYTSNRFDVTGVGCYGAAYPMTLPAGDTWTGNLTTTGATVQRPSA